MRTRTPCYGRLGDTPARDYALKLRLFNALAEPELRQAIASLRLGPGMRVLDVGCGTGESLRWLAAAVAPDGLAVGVDLSASHLRRPEQCRATSRYCRQICIGRRSRLRPLIWCGRSTP
jgi:SAM-dependent methyltransferase